MIRLERPVRRVVPAARRDLVVTLRLEGGTPLVGVREKGRRRGFEVTPGALMVILAQREADAARARKLAQRRARRAGRLS